MAAEAGPEPVHDVVRFALPAKFLKSDENGHAPQVLYPVRASPLPDWLAQAIGDARSGPPPALRGVHDIAPVRARPVIAICIDDLGEDLAGTDKAMALPKEVALSFLPFADTTPFLAEAAARKGHLVLAHVPMQALGRQNPGPDDAEARHGGERNRPAAWAGIWRGCRAWSASTITKAAASPPTRRRWSPVMATLRARHLFFFDSRTGPDSQAMAAAGPRA